ncbi:hypothetical protein [Candidatus Amarolinea dominans]|uniref:hypothetical protein n=1 Tax=Candidatus Amarolinea dominans TaxID=3140696 RepID=UPI001E016B74|nr:hypothetical protein [Anaerolineae bacterium]
MRVRQWLAHSLWTTPAAVGRLAGWLGARQDEARNWVVGMVIVLLVILAVTGVLPVREFLRWLMAVLGLGGGNRDAVTLVRVDHLVAKWLRPPAVLDLLQSPLRWPTTCDGSIPICAIY